MLDHHKLNHGSSMRAQYKLAGLSSQAAKYLAQNRQGVQRSKQQFWPAWHAMTTVWYTAVDGHQLQSPPNTGRRAAYANH